jgi:hypothetical protein
VSRPLCCKPLLALLHRGGAAGQLQGMHTQRLQLNLRVQKGSIFLFSNAGRCAETEERVSQGQVQLSLCMQWQSMEGMLGRHTSAVSRATSDSSEAVLEAAAAPSCWAVLRRPAGAGLLALICCGAPSSLDSRACGRSGKSQVGQELLMAGLNDTLSHLPGTALCIAV